MKLNPFTLVNNLFMRGLKPNAQQCNDIFKTIILSSQFDAKKRIFREFTNKKKAATSFHQWGNTWVINILTFAC